MCVCVRVYVCVCVCVCVCGCTVLVCDYKLFQKPSYLNNCGLHKNACRHAQLIFSTLIASTTSLGAIHNLILAEVLIVINAFI